VNGLEGLRRRLTAARDSASDDRGITLVELMVAMMLLSLLMVMVVGFFVSANRAYRSNTTIDQNTRVASNIMTEVARSLRAASENPLPDNSTDSAFVLASSTSVTFFAYINLDASVEIPEQLQFSVNANNMVVESTWAATAATGGFWTFPAVTSAPTSTRILGGPILPVAKGGPVLFSYNAVDGSAIAGVTTSTTNDVARTIASVDVAVTVGTSSTAGANAALINTVGLPNLPLARTQ